MPDQSDPVFSAHCSVGDLIDNLDHSGRFQILENKPLSSAFRCRNVFTGEQTMIPWEESTAPEFKTPTNIKMLLNWAWVLADDLEMKK